MILALDIPYSPASPRRWPPHTTTAKHAHTETLCVCVSTVQSSTQTFCVSEMTHPASSDLIHSLYIDSTIWTLAMIMATAWHSMAGHRNRNGESTEKWCCDGSIHPYINMRWLIYFTSIMLLLSLHPYPT